MKQLVHEMLNRLHGELAASFSKTTVSLRLQRPMISFTFDDFPKSALKIAGDMLLNQGVRGTYYCAMGLMGLQVTEVGPMFELDDLQELARDGHELGCHTFGHVSCRQIAAETLKQSCEENRRRVVAALDGYQLCNFSFPHGEQTLPAKQALAPVYKTCRTIRPGIHRGLVDFGSLRANQLYSHLDIGHLQRLLDDNAGQPGWVIFYTHDIVSQPSPYGCTPGYFRDALRCAIQSGAEILTVGEAANRILCEANPVARDERDSAASRRGRGCGR
jgi:peptidoglycan/xylan/chitin deacetylase (PgdA/CDA1 family)